MVKRLDNVFGDDCGTKYFRKGIHGIQLVVECPAKAKARSIVDPNTEGIVKVKLNQICSKLKGQHDFL